MDDYSSRIEHLNMKPHAELPNRHQHLLRVAESVADDAQQVWTQIWGEIKTPRHGRGHGFAKHRQRVCARLRLA